MDLEARPVVTIGAKAPSLADVCRIACASIPPRLVLDPKAVARNDEHFINNFKADSQEAWQPVPRPKRQPTMPVTGNIGVGDASVEVVERAVVYATAVIRISTLMAPDSGVRMDFVQGLVDLLNDNKLPSLEATFHDRQALETFAERVYQRQIAEKSPPPNSSTSNGVRSVPGATLRSRSPQGGGSGGTLSQMMKNMKTDDPAKRSFEEEPSAPFVLSEPEAEVFCHGTAFSIARTLVAMQTSHACALFADCATALTVEACKLPLSFVDRSDTMGFAGGANGTSAPLAFPGGTQSVNHIYQLLEDSAVKRLADSEVDPEVMEALAAVPMYSGALTECIAPVQNLVRAEIACTSRRDLVLAAIAAAEDRERKAVDPYHQEQEKTKPSKSAGRAFLMPESRRVDTLRACVLSQVEVMNGLATALLNVVEGCMPKIKQAAAERGTQSALEESKGVDSALIPIDANPVNEESVERLEQRLSHLREQAFEINETEFKIGDSVAPTRGKIAGTLLLEVLALQICTALQLICHDEVRNFNDAVQKLNQNKKSVQKKLNLGKGVDKFKDFAIELIDCHCPPNKRDEMISASEVILHSALGRIGLAAPEITDQLEEILTPVNQGTRIPKVPKGTQDFSPVRMAVREKVFAMIKEIFVKYGAVQIDTPVFELKETLTGKYGEDSKLIYDLKDQGGEQLSLRYDLTVPFARYVAANNIEKIKRFQIGKVYRRDEPQMNRGRFREFYQCDIDFAGSYDLMVPDAEVISILVDLLRAMKPLIGEEFVIRINHRKLLDAMMGCCGVPASSFREICSAIDKLDKESWEDVKREMTETKGLPVEVADRIGKFVEIKGSASDVLARLRSHEGLKGRSDSEEALSEMELLFEYLQAAGVADKTSFDLSLARGLTYYTGVIYEAIVTGKNVGSVGAGGRYDKLVGMFAGRDVPAVGVSLGIERIFRLAEQQLNLGNQQKDEEEGGSRKKKKSAKQADEQLSPTGPSIRENATDVMVCSIGTGMTKKRIEVCRMLREGGIPTEFILNDKLKLVKQLNQANKQQVPLAVIFGEDEIKEGTVKVKVFKYSATDSAASEAPPAATEVEVRRVARWTRFAGFSLIGFLQVTLSELVPEVKRLLAANQAGTSKLDGLL